MKRNKAARMAARRKRRRRKRGRRGRVKARPKALAKSGCGCCDDPSGRVDCVQGGTVRVGGQPGPGSYAHRVVDVAGAGPRQRAGASAGDRFDGADRHADPAGDRVRGPRPAEVGGATQQSLP